MNNTELTIIEQNIQSQITNKHIAPLFIAGGPGTGKSTAIKLIAEKLDMNLVEYSCPTLSIETLTGLPTEQDTPEFNQSSIIKYDTDVASTIWSMPEILANVWNNPTDKPTILLLDDFHEVARHVQSYFYGLLLDKRIGNYRLPDNVAMIGTLNGSEAAGFKGFGSAVRNRMNILNVEFNFDHWFDTFGRHLDYRVSSFLKAKQSYTIESESTDIEGFASARAWTSIAAEIKPHEPAFILANASTIAGMQVSREAANSFGKHVQFIDSINFEDVVAKRTMVNIKDKEMVEQFTYQYISNFIHTVADGKYLLELLDHNKELESFVGFLMGDVAHKYQNEIELTDGLRFAVDILVGQTPDITLYKSTTQKQLDKVMESSYNSTEQILTLASTYLL